MTRRLVDLTGKTFGNWIVISQNENNPKGKSLWHCKCSCGKLSFVDAYKLKNKFSTSCGCIKKTQNGLSKTPEYATWSTMLKRCSNPNSLYFKRGITVSTEWFDYQTFLADMGPKPKPYKQYSLDRVDNNKGYCKENCRWTTATVQQNNKSTNVKLTINGITRNQVQWEQRYKLPRGIIYNRIKRGEPINEHILRQPNDPSQLTINNISKTVAEWSSELNIPISTLHKRIHDSDIIDERIIRSITKAATLTINGITKIYSEWEKEYNLPEGTILRRVKDDWSVNEDMLIPVREIKTITVNGITKTIMDFTKMHDIPYSTLSNRIARGDQLDESIFEKPKLKTLTINGVTKTHSEWEKENNLPPNIIHNRVKHGWPIDESILRPKNQK